MHWQTHTVFNQPTPLNNSNLFLSDTALREAVAREGAGWDGDLLASIGQQLGTAESLELGRLANRGAVNGMMLQVIQGHLTDHVVKEPEETQREADLETVMQVIKSYLK